jgi:hypothetical protein
MQIAFFFWRSVVLARGICHNLKQEIYYGYNYQTGVDRSSHRTDVRR